MSNLTKEQVDFIENKVLPAHEKFNKRGNLRGSEIPNKSMMQTIHVELIGYKPNAECNGCVGGILKRIANKYLEDKKKAKKPKSNSRPRGRASAKNPPNNTGN